MNNGHESMITSTNNELVLPKGVSLALVDANGKILEQDDKVKADIFEAMKREVARFVVSGFKTLTKNDS